MNLWIRSQDKRRLLKIDNFLQEFKDVITFTKEEGLIVLGTYQSEERALEVLDEIQNHTILNQCVPPEHRFYEMPKE